MSGIHEFHRNNVNTEMRDIALKHGIGGYDKLTEEQREQFGSSSDLMNFGVIDSRNNIKYDINGKTVKEIFGITNDNYKKSFNCVRCDSIDIDSYEDVVEVSNKLKSFIEQGKNIYPIFNELCQDIFFSLYKYAPELLPESDIHNSVKINYKLTSLYMNTPQFISLRKACRGEELLALAAMKSIAGRLLDALKEFAAKNKDLKEQLDDIIEKDKQLDDIIDDFLNDNAQPGQAGQTGQTGQAGNTGGGMTLEQARKLAEEISKTMDDFVGMDDLQDDIQTCAHLSYNDSIQDVADTYAVINAWGDALGCNGRIPFQERRTYVERVRNSKRLRKLTDMIGRFIDSAIKAQKKKSNEGAVEINGVTIGDSIQNVLPSELMRLQNPTLKKTFYRDLNEKKLQQYNKINTSAKAKGPIIVCGDMSGSMDGEKDMWCKAMIMAVLEIAQFQKRDFACILYSSTADEPVIITKKEIAPDKTIQLCERFSGGGTSFEAPLRKALEVIDKYKNFKKADIMFISDGDCAISSTFKAEFKRNKEKYDFTCNGVIINTDRYKQDTTSMIDFCDNITDIRDIAELKNADSDTNMSLFSSL